MSRNMKAANMNVFSILKEFIKQSEIPHSYPLDATRYIKTNEIEKKWLKELIVTKTYLLPAMIFASIKFEGKDYFAVIGWESSVEFEYILEPIDMNRGIFTALISELNVSVKNDANSYEIFDEILCFYKESGVDYTGHDFTQLRKFFKPILLYKLSDNSPLNSDQIYNIIGYYLCHNYKKLSLDFSPQTILAFNTIFLEGALSLPYENLLHSLISVQWKYSFLDGYRCLERLFPILQLDELHQKLHITISLLEFASEIEDQIDWKPKEDISLGKIIDKSPEYSIELLRDVKESIDGERSGDLGRRFYKIRNSIVHFRPSTEVLSINDENWDKLIRATLNIIHHWYDIFDLKLR